MYDFDVIIKLLFAMSIKKWPNLGVPLKSIIIYIICFTYLVHLVYPS